MKTFYHVHSFRCNHAEEIPDEAYVEKAIRVGGNSITFTDHCPFHGDLFRGRMQYQQLSEYTETIHNLKKKYKDRIVVNCGLEIEYLPSYLDYYKELRTSGTFDVLMIGQHFYELSPGDYSFMHPEINVFEYQGLTNAIVEGVNTGLFDVVAHPDRSFRRIKHWTIDCEERSRQVIDAALKNDVCLEQNFSSMHHKNHYWNEFWQLIHPENKIIQGIDAHCLEDMDCYVEKMFGE